MVGLGWVGLGWGLGWGGGGVVWLGGGGVGWVLLGFFLVKLVSVLLKQNRQLQMRNFKFSRSALSRGQCEVAKKVLNSRRMLTLWDQTAASS